uniref:Fucosyltransferase n=1 Tax=Leersia perrieri TaxID=77586 RepID=A0A0D9WN72_9ORYZ
MDADKMEEAAAAHPPEMSEKRRGLIAGPGAATVLVLVALPLMLLSYLCGNLAADSVVHLRRFKWSSSSTTPESADRLLGGLLSPDFDEATCLSRYEASRRWKQPSPFPVSPYLVERLRRYEANHRRCGPGTAQYQDAVAQHRSGRRHSAAADDRGECRYVVWLPIQGLGNRMLSLVSTFLYALLTGRVVLVDETPEMEGLFCEPFPGTSWLLPSDFPYKRGFSAESNESYVNMLKNGVVRHDGDGDAAGELPPYVYFHLEQIHLRLQNHTFCDEDHRVLDRFDWMILRSDSYFAVALFLVPAYRAELDMMFPAKGSVFHLLGRYLFHPGNRVWGIVERFYDGYLAAADERLGIQVRIVPQMAVPFEVMYEQIVRCTREHGLLPRVTNTSEPAGVRPSSSSAKVKAVLVVSLKREYYDKLHGVFYTNATAASGGGGGGGEEVVAVYQPSHDGDQHTEARAHNERALAEIYLLSFCDRVVTTAWSTFGYVAHALAGLRPWMLAPLDWDKMRADVACVRPASVEPCLHSPPPLVCRARQDDLDPVARVPFLRHCEDVPAGLKLFD